MTLRNSMNWLGRFTRPKPVLEDPAFGRLEYEKGHDCWHGSVLFGSEDEKLLLTVYGEAPTEAQRDRIREFERRYLDLRPAIAVELFGLYRAHLDEPEEGIPRPANPPDMWEMMHLDGVDLLADGSLVAGYGFRDGLGWDDAVFEVGFEGWVPVGKSLGD